ncbi:MAG: ABC transporter permease [Caldilineaceae bacterium]
MSAGVSPHLQVGAVILWGHALLWAVLLFRWVTFNQFDWSPLRLELLLADLPGMAAYLFYGGALLVDLALGFAFWRDRGPVFWIGSVHGALFGLLSVLYFVSWEGEFYIPLMLLAGSGLLILLVMKHTAWSLAFPAALWLGIFFLLPMFLVLVVSFGERSRLGGVTYPPFDLTNLGAYFDDYVRFFSPVGGDFIYLRIFGRSLWLATLNTVICLIFSYPFAYWIARRPAQYRGLLIFLVMIPFWTNFLVRTYAWMLILRDTGVINNFWTMTLHDLAVALAERSSLFAGLAAMTENPLPLLFNSGAVLVGLFYGYFPFMVLPLYSNLEKLDWSLLEAAADLGANGWHRLTRVLLPLSAPGIVAGSIVVFIPSLERM